MQIPNGRHSRRVPPLFPSRWFSPQWISWEWSWGLAALFLILGCHRGAPTRTPEETNHSRKPTASETRHYLGSSNPKHAENAKPTKTDNWFVDATESSGVHFTYQNGRESQQFTILESVGGGVACIDFDLDGDQDLMVPGGGRISAGSPLVITGNPISLFRNDGQAHFTDVSSLMKSNSPAFYSHGAFVSDFDRDGDPDVLITGFGRCALLRNEAGQSFSDITEKSGLHVPDWSTAATWADINKDGWPDLLIVAYLEWDSLPDPTCGDVAHKIRDVCPPNKYPPARQRVFLNQQNGTFAELPHALDGAAKGKGLGLVATDLNDDGWIDFYIANDQVGNHLYLGGPRFPLPEVGVVSSTAGNEYGIPEGSMGLDASDYDGDGLPDLFVTNFQLEDNSLYRNQGRNLFSHATVMAGLGGACRPQVSFGTGFADFDLDGWLDLFVINGHVLYETGQSAYLEPPFLFRNEANSGQRKFRDVTREHGGPWFQGVYAGRGAAVGDLDNDGDLDLVIVQQNAPVSILLNQLQSKRSASRRANWLRLDVRGTVSDPSAVGAVVTYRYLDRNLVRHIRSGAGYLSQFDQRILFPVVATSNQDPSPDKEKPVENPPCEVTVKWLTGKIETFRELKPGQTNLILEGSGESQE